MDIQALPEIIQVGRCPYCGDEVEIEPTDMCCGEVHGEYAYEDDQGNEYSEKQYLEQQASYKKA